MGLHTLVCSRVVCAGLVEHLVLHGSRSIFASFVCSVQVTVEGSTGCSTGASSPITLVQYDNITSSASNPSSLTETWYNSTARYGRNWFLEMNTTKYTLTPLFPTIASTCVNGSASCTSVATFTTGSAPSITFPGQTGVSVVVSVLLPSVVYGGTVILNVTGPSVLGVGGELLVGCGPAPFSASSASVRVCVCVCVLRVCVCLCVCRVCLCAGACGSLCPWEVAYLM